jgi:hypothetical protein
LCCLEKLYERHRVGEELGGDKLLLDLEDFEAIHEEKEEAITKNELLVC